MLFVILSIVLQVALVVHVVKTGRPTMWIWIIIMLPLAGMIAYFLIELLPDLLGTRTGRQATHNLKKIINPNRNLNDAALNYSISDTVENSLQLARECLDKQMYDEAKRLYEKCLTGLHKDDPDIMFGLARAEHGLQHHAAVKALLDELIATNPNYKNHDAHLLYAVTLEMLGEIDKALEEYVVLDRYYPGPEPTYRYAALLKQQGRVAEAKQLLEKILTAAKTSGRHYNSLHKEWINKAKAILREC
ncbi:MAG: hypothetical protein OEZ39_19925 [Gammaproteobacteria bacterium]|nr:hypothetical protein [Gammaproteobacteria bacterium]MDH5654137.1 hypothetical protein [Gammaproteobacteria bacterium]